MLSAPPLQPVRGQHHGQVIRGIQERNPGSQLGQRGKERGHRTTSHLFGGVDPILAAARDAERGRDESRDRPRRPDVDVTSGDGPATVDPVDRRGRPIDCDRHAEGLERFDAPVRIIAQQHAPDHGSATRQGADQQGPIRQTLTTRDLDDRRLGPAWTGHECDFRSENLARPRCAIAGVLH